MSIKTVNCPRCGKAGQLQPVEDGKVYYELHCDCTRSGPVLKVAADQVDKYPSANKEFVLGDEVKKGSTKQ